MSLRTPISTLFPYTTLFRSHICVITDMGFFLYKKGRLRKLTSQKWGEKSSEYSFPIPPCESFENKYLRSAEHTSELQSRGHLVCRLLLEKKKQITTRITAKD